VTIDEFCRAHNICRQTYFNLKARGLGPETIRQGRRDLITEDAASVWRLRMGTPLAEGELSEILVLTTAALPDLIRQFGSGGGVVEYYRRLGTILSALGAELTIPGPGSEAVSAGEE
jgi:hypothetical protein